MSTAGELAPVLNQLPGWEDARCERLAGGLSNDTFLLTAGERKAVLKIDTAPRSVPLNQREFEARLQRSAHAAGLAAKVLFASDNIYLTEYLDGRVWQPLDLVRVDKLQALAAALKRVHALPLTGRTFNALQAAQIYLAELRGRGADELQAAACLATIKSYQSPVNLCCCHNDLVAENIISADGIRLLDWEYACDNDPFFDLATVIAHHRLDETHAAVLLDAYFDGDGAKWQHQLRRQQHLYNALAWLWSASRS